MDKDVKTEIDESGKVINKNIFHINGDGQTTRKVYTEYYYEKSGVRKEETIINLSYENGNTVTEEVQSEGKIFYAKNLIFHSQNNLVGYEVENQ